jgi:hypothetical protein
MENNNCDKEKKEKRKARKENTHIQKKNEKYISQKDVKKIEMTKKRIDQKCEERMKKKRK